ncbi:MAG: hypothetical protein JNN30_08180 [Rhodanobacteraceae bacterium]|nr:hypothetical protein [Rhodanobacteraceae bacterium]
MTARRTLSAASLVIAAATILAPASAAQASWFTDSWAGLISFWGSATLAQGCIPADENDCGVQPPQ